MEDSFFEYRNDTVGEIRSDSEDAIDDSFVGDAFAKRKSVPRSAKKNQTVVIPESDESESGEETESYDESDAEPSNRKSLVGRISAAGDSNVSSDYDTTRGPLGRISESSNKVVSSSSSSDEEVSPEIIPKRRPLLKKVLTNRLSESPLIRRVKRRMMLTDSETDNSIIIENDRKMQCLKDTPEKIETGSKVNNIDPKNLTSLSDDDDEDKEDEDEIVMSRATRMSIMGVRVQDLASDESDLLQSDESNIRSRGNSAIGSTNSLEELPDVDLTQKNTEQSVDNDESEDANDSKISCSTFGSPVKENSASINHSIVYDSPRHNESNNESVGKLVIDEPPQPVKEVVKTSIDLVDDDEDDEVAIIDSKTEVIALSSDEDEPKPVKRSPKSPKKPVEVKKLNTVRQYLVPPSHPNHGVVYVKKHVRENELMKLQQLKEDLNNVRNLLENMDVDTLPDGGVKLIERLTALERQVRAQGDKVANMIVEPDNPTTGEMSKDGFSAVKAEGLSWEDIQKASNQVQPRMFGKQAMSTHMAERDTILSRLRDLHSSLASRPVESAKCAQPQSLKSALMPHQAHALAWLRWRETQRPRGGILADDMGLGKTITIIALILSSMDNKIHDDDEDDADDEWTGKENSKLPVGGTLVVCPASLLQQWAGEVAAHTQPHSLSVALHHGANRPTQPKRVAGSELVVTTYNILLRDFEKTGALFRVRWRRVVLDEAHAVRNHKSQSCAAVCGLKAGARWCLTGTPLQNKDLDLFALLKFLKCTPFDELPMWKKWIDNKSQGGQERLATIMQCLLLRRTKAQLQLKGQLDCLPDRDVHQIHVTLASEEMNVYQKVLVFSKTLFAQFLHQRAEKQADAIGFTAGRKDDAYEKMHKKMAALQGAKPVKSHEILVLLLRLRQVCCHCGLIAAMLDETEAEVEGDAAGLDLLNELNKLTLEDDKDRRKSVREKSREPSPEPPSEGTTAAEAIRSVLSPNNPVFSLERPSSKIKAVMECLEKNVFCKPGEKAVVVSQWTSVLSLVGAEVRARGLSAVTLSGQVPVAARPPLIKAINDQDSGVRVMLLSLMAGGVGLNLCGANHLLLLDPHWNPQLEQQAQDRIYRVGQTKHVHVYRFMCTGTVEQTIRNLQEHKLELANSVLTGAKHNSTSKLSIEDLKLLFNMGQS